jgi:RHS repeat-associated protein
VEQSRSGIYYQVVYSSLGAKLGIFKGQTLQEGFVPLPGSTQAEYMSWGLSDYRHPDWQGSDRLESTTSHAIVSAAAYAPFGEPYAENGSYGDLSFTGANKDTLWLDYDFLYREYDPKQGRWISPDPAGSAAVDPTNPQTWNRYSYVGNTPCSLVDPFGLSSCNFNIAINKTSLLTSQELANAQSEISRILALADLGANFTSNSADFTVNLTNNPTGLVAGILWGQQWDTLGQNSASFAPTNSATVWVNSTEMAAAGMDMGTALGRVMTHEFGHWALNMVHTYPSPGPLETGIMSQGFGPILMTGMATLTPAQISALQSKCQQLHPRANNPAGGGGNAFGNAPPSCQLIELTNCGDEGCGTSYIFTCGGGGGGGPTRNTF